MDAEALGRFIEEHYHQPGDRLFRMEVLSAYEVASDSEDYRRWLAGSAEPTWSRKQAWLDTLRRERENGQVSTRVRILSERVSDYEQYACGFGYRYNGEYEDVRVLRRSEHEIPPGLIERDFWIRAFNPVMVLGVLQTPAYAATVLGTSEDDPLVTGRTDRQREMIADQRRHWTLIQTEGALLWQAHSPTVMAEQVEHLIELGNAPNVELGVIDWRTTVEVFPHAHPELADLGPDSWLFQVPETTSTGRGHAGLGADWGCPCR